MMFSQQVFAFGEVLLPSWQLEICLPLFVDVDNDGHQLYYVFTLSEMFMVIFIRQEARCNGKLVQAMSSQCYDVSTMCSGEFRVESVGRWEVSRVDSLKTLRERHLCNLLQSNMNLPPTSIVHATRNCNSSTHLANTCNRDLCYPLRSVGC